MNIILTGKNLDDIRPLLPDFGMTECENESENIDLVVTHGGDGALLGAERLYPGIPKLPIRDMKTAPACAEHSPEKRLENFCNFPRKFTLPKLSGEFWGQEIYGINDIVIYNDDRSSALRYRVSIDGELYAAEVVGDGVVLASIHGSTAYYRSITHSSFRTGIGLAFNNSTEELNHLVLNENSIVEIEILRGPAILSADNDPVRIAIPEKAVVTLKQSGDSATVYNLNEFMCPVCRRLRHPDKYPAN